MKKKIVTIVNKIKEKLKSFSLFKKAKGIFEKIKAKYREKFPKREPKIIDGADNPVQQTKFILKLLLFSFLIYLYIEEFARFTDGVFDGIKYLFESPLVFFCNWMIIFATMTIALLFKRRSFVFLVVSAVWLVLGTVNGVILLKRMTPFTIYDLSNLEDGFTIITNYFSTVQIILLAAAIVIALLFMGFYYFGCNRWTNIDYKKSVITIVLAFAVAGGTVLGFIKIGVLSTFFGNLNYAYQDYGFPYCFINTTLNTGISKPDDYSEELIESILENYTSSGTDTVLETVDDDDEYPNIIILQLESFVWAQDLTAIELSNDPTPVFTSLMENYTTGTFTVPACGAGTANTEFEVLTGISAKFFGPGEYPYKSVLRTTTQESLAYILKNHGYATSAVHNHRALFYNRNEVYANLGFDSYTSLEFISDITKTPTGWCKDEVLVDEVIDILESTEERDFIHVVSVEGHGSYPTEQVFKDPYTTVTADDEATRWKYEYYVNELHEMDTFLGDLIEAIEESGEPTILLIYGDHVPAIGLSESDYALDSLYETRYIIWDNIGLEKNDEDTTSYEIGAVLLELAGLSGEGVIFDFQQTTDSDDENYLTYLSALAYDMLYGENYVFGGTSPYETTDMTLGHSEIVVDEVVKIGDTYYVKGENFTERSRISLDGETLSTVYLSSTLLALGEDIDEEDVERLTVSQIDTKTSEVLSTVGALEEL